MFHPKVAYENLEIKFNEKPFYLGGSQVPVSLGINNSNISNTSIYDNDNNPNIIGTGIKKSITKCVRNK